MLNENALVIPRTVCHLKTYLLSRRIAAIRLKRTPDGQRGKLGEFLQLDLGVRVDYCGDGYNERTVKIHCNGEFYFVFRQDLNDAGVIISNYANVEKVSFPDMSTAIVRVHRAGRKNAHNELD